MLEKVPGYRYPGTERTSPERAAHLIRNGLAELVEPSTAFQHYLDENFPVKKSKKKKRAKNEKNIDGAGAGRKSGKRGKRSNS